MQDPIDKKTRVTFTDYVRLMSKGIIYPIAGFFTRIGLSPNMLTLIGLIGNAVGAYFLARGMITVGGLIILVMAPLDALDGAMARIIGEKRTDSPGLYGAFLDSVSDRYAELFLFGGLLIYYSRLGDWLPVLLAYLAAAGSVLVSYTRARGQSLGIDTKVGFLTRLERYLILVPCLIFNIPLIGLWILAVFTNLTALQRIVDVRYQFSSQKKE